MLVFKIKMVVALVLVVTVVAAGAGTVGYHALTAKAREEGRAQNDPVKPETKPPAADAEKKQLAKAEPTESVFG